MKWIWVVFFFVILVLSARGVLMKKLSKLTLIGLIAGTALAASLIIVYWMTGNMAFYLLFNVDYIPILKEMRPTIVIEIAFHYLFCIVSVILLYYVLAFFRLEHRVMIYVIVYTGGSAILYYLTLFTNYEPHSTDVLAWLYWTGAHTIYSVIVGMFIRRWA